MNILFLTLIKIETLQKRGIYHDLMREFASHHHSVYIISPTERKEKKPSSLTSEGNVHFLNIRTLNVQKTNLIEKGVSILTIELLYLRGVRKYFNDVKFDLIIYSTPPITFTRIINYIKNKDGAQSYLLLKDIFPQNAVDMKMMSKVGIIYHFFRNKEKKLYQISDVIGCMSEANRQYILKHNPKLDSAKVEVNPNAIEPITHIEYSQEEKDSIKIRYDLPLQKKIFIYGGNLGIPQGLDFLLETIEAVKDDSQIFFLIVGSGTEFDRIQNWIYNKNPNNAKLISSLAKDQFDELMKACDVGLIFLHKDFTIPNFPSRLLTYLEFKLPVLVAADSNTDIGTEVEKHKAGVSVLSGDLFNMIRALHFFSTMSDADLDNMRNNSRKYLEENFLVSQSYQKIMKRIRPHE